MSFALTCFCNITEYDVFHNFAAETSAEDENVWQLGKQVENLAVVAELPQMLEYDLRSARATRGRRMN